uniref:Plexin B3 n=1 Tax=Leptobrachium leishanense TaxID=445787 RepID=A0A8C5R3V3_9ANUR
MFFFFFFVLQLVVMLDLVRLLPLLVCISFSDCFPYFLRPNVTFNHMARDPGSGSIYVGAVNWIYQLTSDLDLFVEDSTGPQLDSPECISFKDPKDCPKASLTPNFNKLLTANIHNGTLLTCGHVFQGICEKRNLHNISNIIYRTVDPGDNQFVAANVPQVSTVGIVVRRTPEGHDYLFVGRGLTARQSSGIPPITIRQLDTPPVFSNDGLGKLVVGDFSDYNNTFVGVFSDNGYVYFLFYRRGFKSQMEYKTYLGSVCSQDLHLYSYVEVPLVCKEASEMYNLAQAAYLETSTRELFVIFATTQGSGPNPSNRRALCSYKMDDIEQRIKRARDLCYTKSGKGEGDLEESVIEYGVNSKCAALPDGSALNFPCGGEHTPSPIASRVPVDATPLLTDDSSLTAVTALVEDSKLIVFLGNAIGSVKKVYVSSGKGSVYDTIVVVPDSPISPDLLLDDHGRRLYVMTESQVTRLPVSECSRFYTCNACLQAGDPFCGWCVLRGECTEKKQCADYKEENHWLLSFGSQTQCPSIQAVVPADQSRQDQTDISMTVLQLPAVADQESWRCLFNERSTVAHVDGDQIICSSPPPEELPPNQLGKDHVTVHLTLVFHNVSIAVTNFTFYDCGAVMELSTNAPCGGCVSSPWKCYWCVSDHRCTHSAEDCSQDQTVIFSQNQNVSSVPSSPFLLLRSFFSVPSSPFLLLRSFFSVPPSPFPLLRSPFSVPPSPFPLLLVLYNCSVGQPDCSSCRALDPTYSCIWCGDDTEASCVYNDQCQKHQIDTCPTPVIHTFFPQTGIIHGGTTLTISGVDMGQKAEEVSVSVAGHSCSLDVDLYMVSNRLVFLVGYRVCNINITSLNCTTPSLFQDPELLSLSPLRGPMAGGTMITIFGSKLLTGDQIAVTLGDIPCKIFGNVTNEEIQCITNQSPELQELSVQVFYGTAKKVLEETQFIYTENPTISFAGPSSGFYGGGRVIRVSGSGLDVVQHPLMSVLAKLVIFACDLAAKRSQDHRLANLLFKIKCLFRVHFSVSGSEAAELRVCMHGQQSSICLIEPCHHNSSDMECVSPSVPENSLPAEVMFVLDNVRIPFSSVGENFTYHKNPSLKPLNRDDRDKPYNLKPGNVLDIEGEGLDSGISKQEVVAMIGDGICTVKTLTHNHLYCEPPHEVPQPLHASSSQLEFVVKMGKLEYHLGKVQYDIEGQSTFPKEAKIGLAVGGALLIPIVLIIIFMYRRQSKLAMRDYKKVLVQLENLETSVGDQCKKEFTDLMTEMMDLTSDLEASGIPFLDHKTYVERIFFPGQASSPLRKTLDVPEGKRNTVEQGLTQLSNLLNNKLFLTKLIETLDAQPTLSQRDRCHAASLLMVALHGKLEYLTDVMKTLLIGLIEQCVAKNPKLLLRRSRTLSMIILRCLLVCFGGEVQRVPVRVLDTDTITQVKRKILNNVYKGTPFSQRPAVHTLDLEWRSGNAGHLTLNDEDLTSLTQDQWKRLNTLHHYKVPDNATVALIPRLHNNQFTSCSVCPSETPMLEDGEEGGVKPWHLVKSLEEPEVCRNRRSSLRERERAKAIPEIYLTRLLSMKGTLQKFVDDTFQVMLGVNRPVPIAVKYFFDFLDEMAEKHEIEDAETVHIWKTHSLMQRFWVLILKHPQMIFDVEVSENVDSILSVIAQTFIDSCTISEHKVGRDSPVNKLLYARDIPRYKHLVEKYYADIRQTAPASYQEMNSSLTELSGVSNMFSPFVALHDLYAYIVKYYDPITAALEEDPNGQKMQLAYRLQQISSLVENKVTDL